MTVLDGFDAGDDITLRLHVVPDDGVPADGTTVVTLALLDPTGALLAPAAAPVDPDDRSRWKAVLTAALPGEYTGTWTVTGTGAGRQPVTVLVGPATGVRRGRTYATTAQLAEHLGTAPPAGAHRLLVAATERVDELLRTAVYDVVGPDEIPTDPAVAAALAEATCAQAAWFAETGEDGTGLTERYTDVKIGTVRLGGGQRGGAGAADAPDPRYAPGAVRALRKVPGLLTTGPLVMW